MSTGRWIRAAFLAQFSALTLLTLGTGARADTYSFANVALIPVVSGDPTLYISGSFTLEPNSTRIVSSLTKDWTAPEAVSFQIFEEGKLIRNLTDTSYFIYMDGITNTGIYSLSLYTNGYVDALADQILISFEPSLDGATEVAFSSSSFRWGFLGNPVLKIDAAVPEPSTFVLVMAGLGLMGATTLGRRIAGPATSAMPASSV